MHSIYTKMFTVCKDCWRPESIFARLFSLFLMIKTVKSTKPEIELDKKNGENILHPATGNTRIKDFRASPFVWSYFSN